MTSSTTTRNSLLLLFTLISTATKTTSHSSSSLPLLKLSITAATIRINNTFARRSILSFSSPTIFTSRSTST
uniref:Secreted protein n=1 Tax=Meloidogyne incognita TaxID=6306 RepID=A0A914MYY5_MELIC